MRFLGVDPAWSEGRPGRPARETGVVALGADGRIEAAGWTRGVEATSSWILALLEADTVIAIDAPLLLPNPTGARECERDVARGYGRWKLAATPSSRALPWQAGRVLAERLAAAGVALDDGVRPVPSGTPAVFECYPYTTLVGVVELGYDDRIPRYKRLERGVPAPEARRRRKVVTDDLLQRCRRLESMDPPMDLRSNPVTARLLDDPSPDAPAAHKHREDLLDAALCAWTAALRRRSPERLQVLGSADAPDRDGRRATILAPARPEQRRGPAPVPLSAAPAIMRAWNRSPTPSTLC